MNSRIWNNKKVKVPTVIQMEAVECGAAALGMILAYHGKYVPLEELREKCGVSRDGSKAINMVKTARQYGLTAKGFKAEEVNGLKNLPLPMIVFWNFNHFVVLTGIIGKKVYLNDPAFGPVVISLDEFDESFTGFAMFFEPGPNFNKSGKKPCLFRPLFDRLRGSYASLLFLVISGFLLVIPGLVVPVFFRIFIDDILVGQKLNWLNPLIFIMVLTAVIVSGLTFLQSRYLLSVQMKLALTGSSKFFYHVLRLPMRFFFQRYAGEIGSRVGINDDVAGLMSGEIATNFINIFLIVFYALLMFQYDVLLTVIAIFVALLNLLALKYAASKRVVMNQRLVQENGKFTGTAMSGLQIIETLKSTGSESDFFSMFSGYQARSVNSSMQMGYSSIMLSTVPVLLLSINSAIILILGASRVMDGVLTMGMLVAFQALTASFVNPVSALMGLGSRIQVMGAQFNKLDDVLAHQKDSSFILSKDVEEPKSLKLEGYIEIKNLKFGYCRLDPPLIENFNLSLKPGNKIAIVGASGSGKSTMGRIISGLYEPWEGEILFDKKSRFEYPRNFMNNSISIVDQNIFMFKGTVNENLTLWDTTVPNSHIKKAAHDACIHYEISSRLSGYENVLTEDATNYSGGQRQRMEIARALVNNPSILILDEATSSLDPITEKQIYDNIRQRGCTCIIIAHRLSTIRDCDEIIVMDHGKIVQRGTHNELIKIENGPYAEFIKLY